LKDKEIKLIKWINGGGIVAAIVSSLCCIGPFIFGTIGIGGATSLLFLDQYRGIIIGIVITLIGLGWFMNYRLEKNECKEGTICADPKKRKMRRMGLSISSFIALLFVISPFVLDSVSQAQNKTLAGAGKVKTLYVEGMTCGGCEIGVREALKRAGLSDQQILSVDHTNPNPKKNIGSAVIKISDELGCKIIKEIKSSPGYIAYWSFENKDPCNLKSTNAHPVNLDSVKKIISSTYDPKMNKICKRGCAEKSVNYKKDEVAPNGNASIGEVTKCPISGVIFRVKKTTPKFQHNGKSYQFCCRTCAAKFKSKVKKV